MKLGWSLATRYYVLTIVLILLVLLAWSTRELFSPLVIAGLIAYVLIRSLTCYQIAPAWDIVLRLIWFTSSV